MAREQDEDAVQNLLDMKMQLEKKLNDLNAEKESLWQKLKSIRDRKDEVRKLKITEFQRVYQLNITLADSEAEARAQSKHIEDSNQFLKQLEAAVQDKMKMSDFEEEISKTRASMEGAINFYAEDSLRIEFMKRNKLVSDKRVELTEVETEFERLKKKISDEKEERERAQRAEEERIRAETERLKQLQEDQARMERERQREMFRASELVKKSPPMTPDRTREQQSFLGSEKSLYTLNGGQIEPKESKIPGFDKKSSGADVEGEIPQGVSFSQLLKW